MFISHNYTFQLCSNIFQLFQLNAWLTNRSKKLTTGIVFIDLAKAFDSLNHDLLLHKLACLSLHPSTLRLLQSFLSNRTQCVKVGSTTSSSVPLIKGVPQGSLLGPILFTVFINEVLNLPMAYILHAYADDMTLYFSHQDPNVVTSQINKDLKLINKWCGSSGLTINVDKTKAMIIHPRRPIFSEIKICSEIQLDIAEVLPVTVFKLLGLRITDSLSFRFHISSFRRPFPVNCTF